MEARNEQIQDAGKRKCVRYGREGNPVTETRDAEVVGLWEKFNRDFRPESALFVEGTCTHLGAYSKEECSRMEAELRVAAPEVVSP